LRNFLPELAAKLTVKYGKSFSERNLYRMMLFATRFPDAEILPPLAAKLNWSHFIELLPLKSDEARFYYTNDAATRNYGAKVCQCLCFLSYNILDSRKSSLGWIDLQGLV
jgi:hypothetical protein